MKEKIIQVSSEFWNIRGSFKIGGVVDIKTHASLVRLGNGNFVFLDSYSMSPEARNHIADLTADGGEIEAILNVHPFHTMHVERMHELYPDARLYGTNRHQDRFPELPWEEEPTESAELHALYVDDFDFSVPDGVDFIPVNENVHFSSVLVKHRASQTIHVDDTVMCLQLPRLLRMVGVRHSVGFHPTLSLALEKRAGAAADFRAWAEALIEDWGDAKNLCAAHTGILLARENTGAPISKRLKKALRRSEPQLRIHQRIHG